MSDGDGRNRTERDRVANDRVANGRIDKDGNEMDGIAKAGTPLDAVIEFTVEPFVAGDPGAHVYAAVAAVEAAGLAVEWGPFSTVAEGDSDTILLAVPAMLRCALDAGADRIVMTVERASMPGSAESSYGASSGSPGVQRSFEGDGPVGASSDGGTVADGNHGQAI